MTNLVTALMHRAMGAHALIVVVGLAAPLLAGCETASSIFGGSSPEVSASLAPATTASTAPSPMVARVAIVPVMGAPDTVSGQLSEMVAEALERQQISVAKGKDTAAEYYVRGYVVAAKDAAGTKLSYIWDITDKNGSKRAHRIQGEQVVKAPAGSQDPWAAIDATVARSIASQTADKIAKWLPPSSGPSLAIAQAGTPPAQRALASGAGIPATTASIARKSDGTAFVAPVVGAPGDGTSSLTAAIRRELTSKSVPLVDQAGAGSNRVEGRVSLSPAASGKQVVQIEWIVTDASGAQLGVVTQKNTIAQGSLDGAWGQTADSAASAAAVKISSLLKK